MHIKFLPHGTGSGKDAADYLTGAKDHKGELRADVQVLRGNPEQVGQLIDSLETVQRYSSGVIAFHVDDDPTSAEVDKVLNDFEALAFAGLEPDQYTWSAVLHQEKDGSKHIHAIVPRVELTTGLSMNVAPPNWESRFYPLRDALNYEHGWARPDDPRLARTVQPGRLAQFTGWKEGQDPRQQITDWMSTLVSSGAVSTRAHVLDALGTIGSINRQGKDYVSIKVEGAVKPIRLKGELYGEHFDGHAIRRDPAKAQGRSRGREPADSSAARAARERLAKIMQGRADYNRKQYRRNTEHDRQPPTLVDALAAARDRGRLRADDLMHRGVQHVDSLGRASQSTGSRKEHRPPERDVLRESSGQSVLHSEIGNDRTRDPVTEQIGRIERTIQDGHGYALQIEQSVRESSRTIDGRNESLRDSRQQLDLASEQLEGRKCWFDDAVNYVREALESTTEYLTEKVRQAERLVRRSRDRGYSR